MKTTYGVLLYSLFQPFLGYAQPTSVELSADFVDLLNQKVRKESLGFFEQHVDENQDPLFLATEVIQLKDGLPFIENGRNVGFLDSLQPDYYRYRRLKVKEIPNTESIFHVLEVDSCGDYFLIQYVVNSEHVENQGDVPINYLPGGGHKRQNRGSRTKTEKKKEKSVLYRTEKQWRHMQGGGSSASCSGAAGGGDDGKKSNDDKKPIKAHNIVELVQKIHKAQSEGDVQAVKDLKVELLTMWRSANQAVKTDFLGRPAASNEGFLSAIPKEER